jgi:glycosyltransferase involved in cell wall biosynthesis
MESVSIIICCYNSEHRIKPTIKHIAKLYIPNTLEWEVILVDNNSTDNTVSLAEKVWKQCGSPTSLHIVKEERPGLTFAREKGADIAQYKYILYCDDDNWLDTNYLKVGIALLENNPKMGVLGGKGIPFFEIGDEPYWFKQFEGVYATGRQAATSSNVTFSKGYVFGAGMFVRKELILYPFFSKFILTDRVLGSLSSGGDSELCYRIILKNYEIWYNDSLIFHHFIPTSRISLDYVKRFFYDTIGVSFMVSGLLYKINIHPTMYNHPFKRTWQGQILFLIKGILKYKPNPLGLKFHLLIKLKQLIFLLEVRKKYNDLFKSESFN